MNLHRTSLLLVFEIYDPRNTIMPRLDGQVFFLLKGGDMHYTWRRCCGERSARFMTSPAKQGEGTDKIDVRYVARLARLDLTSEEIRSYQEQLGQIVQYVRHMNRLDLSGVPPTDHTGSLVNVFRKDEQGPSLDREAALKNAPVTASEQFVVPKIVE